MKATDHTDETYTMRQPESAQDITAHTDGSVTARPPSGATPRRVTIHPGPFGSTGFPFPKKKGNRRKRKAQRKMQRESRRKNRNK